MANNGTFAYLNSTTSGETVIVQPFTGPARVVFNTPTSSITMVKLSADGSTVPSGDAFSNFHWDFGDQSTVTVHVRRLREKIEPDPARPTRIATVWGVGYRYDRAGA